MDKKEQFEKDLMNLAIKYSLIRIKTETAMFKRDYQVVDNSALILTSEKAVVTALGKTSVVPIGAGEQCQTYGEAAEFVRKHWAQYFKARRELRSDKEKIIEAKRQKKYRERRKQKLNEFKRRG